MKRTGAGAVAVKAEPGTRPSVARPERLARPLKTETHPNGRQSERTRTIKAEPKSEALSAEELHGRTAVKLEAHTPAKDGTVTTSSMRGSRTARSNK